MFCSVLLKGSKHLRCHGDTWMNPNSINIWISWWNRSWNLWFQLFFSVLGGWEYQEPVPPPGPCRPADAGVRAVCRGSAASPRAAAQWVWGWVGRKPSNHRAFCSPSHHALGQHRLSTLCLCWVCVRDRKQERTPEGDYYGIPLLPSPLQFWFLLPPPERFGADLKLLQFRPEEQKEKHLTDRSAAETWNVPVLRPPHPPPRRDDQIFRMLRFLFLPLTSVLLSYFIFPLLGFVWFQTSQILPLVQTFR